MLPRLFLLLIFVVLLIPARANLGETVPEIVARYGKPIGYAEASAKTPFGSILFRAGAYELVLFILNNKEVGARISKIDKTAFSDAEIQTIMSAESGASKWISALSDAPSDLQWSRRDQATFLYDKDKHMLLLTSVAMAQALRASSERPSGAPSGGKG